jgi:RNA polymerase sigma-32 factor
MSPELEAAEREIERRNARMVASALGKLDARERLIVQKRILDDETNTLSDIGTKVGLSRERVRQIEAKACEKLRDALCGSVA